MLVVLGVVVFQKCCFKKIKKVHGKVGFGKERMCSYKHTHNSAVHIIANVGSSVLAEGEVSTSNSPNIQGAVNGDLKIKQEFGLAYIVGLSYKHKFIDRQGKILNETHSATLGVLGVLGTTFEWDSSGTLQNIYFGVDVSGNIGVGIGASGSLKLGWLYNFND